MTDYSRILKNNEKAIYILRELYGLYGYNQFRAGKFEEYDLYVRNKDFLGNDGILSFTDPRGRAIALKPDITLSIAKNYEYEPGVTRKLYYDDYVYRLSADRGEFREISQTGIECIGDISDYDVCEVIMLAIKSMEMISEDFVLDISHMGINKGLTAQLNLPDDEEKQLMHCISRKNVHGIRSICERNNINNEMTVRATALVNTYGSMDKIIEEIDQLAVNRSMSEAINELRLIDRVMKKEMFSDKIRFDFSVVNDMGYYNGVVFQGFVKGLPTGILAGGRYDNLIKKMGKKGGAIGFSISLDMLEGLNDKEKALDLDEILIVDRNDLPEKINDAVRTYIDRGDCIAVQKAVPKNLKYGKLLRLKDGKVIPFEYDG